MQDRFKFRVVYYNDVEKKYFIFEPDLISADGTARTYAYGESGADEYYDTVTLNQCTGLKDKNGKLIFEGDILQENWHKYILEWGNGAYVIKDIKRGTSYMFTSGLCIEKSEVIGNIYENKELLNEI